MDTIKVLFVEDEPDIRFIVEISMNLNGRIKYKGFESGQSALTHILKSREIFDFALLNLRLGDMTGIELHERLREIPGFENITSAVITASVRDSEIADYKRAGIKGHISKPFNPLTLALEIERIYDK